MCLLCHSVHTKAEKAGKKDADVERSVSHSWFLKLIIDIQRQKTQTGIKVTLDWGELINQTVLLIMFRLKVTLESRASVTWRAFRIISNTISREWFKTTATDNPGWSQIKGKLSESKKRFNMMGFQSALSVF